MTTLAIRHLGVRYASKGGLVDALSDVNLTVARGQYIEGAQDDDWHDYNEGRPPIGSGPGRDRAHFTPRSTGHTSSRSSEANG